MNTTTPARRAGVAVRTGANDLTAQRRAISIDWTCLTLLQPDDRRIDAAAVYAELGLHVIPDPAHPGSSPLASRETVLLHWRRSPASRVGLLVGPRFEALAVRTDRRGLESLHLMARARLLDSYFAQVQRAEDVLLLFAPGGLQSRRIGLAGQEVNVIGQGDRLDVTPSDSIWVSIEPAAYSRPIPVAAIETALS